MPLRKKEGSHKKTTPGGRSKKLVTRDVFLPSLVSEKRPQKGTRRTIDRTKFHGKYLTPKKEKKEYPPLSKAFLSLGRKKKGPSAVKVSLLDPPKKNPLNFRKKKEFVSSKKGVFL